MSSRVLLLGASAAALCLLSACNFGQSASSSSASASGASTSAAAPAVQRYENSTANARSPSLAQNFVGFSFDFPNGWIVDPQTGSETAQNFVKVLTRAPSGRTPRASRSAT